MKDVQYLVVGANAVIYHGYVRATVDFDLFIANNHENLKNLYNALIELGYKENNCRDAVQFFKENHMIRIHEGKYLVELLDSFMVQTDFDQAFQNKESAKFDDIEVNIIGYDDLIRIKSRSTRDKDHADIKGLKKIREMKEKISNSEKS